MTLLEFTNNGIYCPIGKFYIDPWRPVDFAVITHGHGDHARWGMKHYLCQAFTVPILKARIGEDISVQSLKYGESITINGIKLSMHPAGHILGSSQIRLEYQGFVSVVSGDYKVQDDGLSTPFETVRCNEFVTESTFGLPIYHWLSVEEMEREMQNWVSRNRAAGKTSIFIGYSLGKAQRIMKALNGSGRMFVHSSIDRLNKGFADVGIQLPQYELLDLNENRKAVEGEIVIVPPALLDSNIIKKVPNGATALCSGWMQVRGSRRWRSADAGFAISDHADWDGLLTAIKSAQAEKVFVTHGFTDVFSKYLNEIGIEAEPVKTQFGDEIASEDTGSDALIQSPEA